ncbi:MAG: hypothetical protein EXQ69_05520 [Acidimicrobiia bacterium]|nr:hypothetical protein [Acidimicrobiia bacterium]
MIESTRDRVTVTGPDTWTFLQNLLSQDLDGIAEGERRQTLMLTPKGKVDVAAGITRVADDAVLDMDTGWGERLVESLERFKIRTKVEILLEAGTPPTADDEIARIEAGIPRMGAELDDSVIPQEAFLEVDGVSFTKGCFVGQELVCRIDTRGHVNRYLRHLRFADVTVSVGTGSDVVSEGKVVGSVTSSAPGISLGFVRGEVEPNSSVSVNGITATVEALPTSG